MKLADHQCLQLGQDRCLCSTKRPEDGTQNFHVFGFCL